MKGKIDFVMSELKEIELKKKNHEPGQLIIESIIYDVIRSVREHKGKMELSFNDEDHLIVIDICRMEILKVKEDSDTTPGFRTPPYPDLP